MFAHRSWLGLSDHNNFSIDLQSPTRPGPAKLAFNLQVACSVYMAVESFSHNRKDQSFFVTNLDCELRHLEAADILTYKLPAGSTLFRNMRSHRPQPNKYFPRANLNPNGSQGHAGGKRVGEARNPVETRISILGLADSGVGKTSCED